MSVIENFSLLSKQEQLQFTEDLLAKINADRTFIDGHPFEIYKEYGGVEASELTGDLYIDIAHKDYIEVPRAASWYCSDDDSWPEYESDVEYLNNDVDDAKKVFKTLSAVVDGYKVTLEVDDLNSDGIEDVDVGRSTSGDAGIGSYEYFGYRGYDSRPYTEADGIITVKGDLSIYLTVEPIK